MIHLAQTLTYDFAILDEDGIEVFTSAPKRNLLTDAGLDLIGNANKHPLDLIKQVSIGTGDTPTKRDSGATTFAASAGLISASAGFFEAGDVGRLLKWDSGPEKYITGYNSPTQVTYAGGPDVAAAPGMVWYVNRQSLHTLHSNFTTLAKAGDAAYNGSSAAGSTVTHKRTMVSDAFVAPAVIKELGWGPVGGATLFGLDLLPAPIAIGVGKQLRVRLSLEQTLPDITQVVAAADVGSGGINTVGTTSFDFISWPNITGVFDTNGNINGGVGGTIFHHSTNQSFAVLVAQTEPYVQTPGSTVKTIPIGQIKNDWTRSNYVNGQRWAERVAEFAAGTFSGQTIHAILLGGSDGYTMTNTWSLKPTTPFTVSAEQKLSVTFRFSWDRVLSNA